MVSPFRECLRPIIALAQVTYNGASRGGRQPIAGNLQRVWIAALRLGFRCRERGQRDTEEPDALSDRKQRFQQRMAQLFEFGAAGNRYLAGVAPGDLPEIRELDLECDGAPASPRTLAMPPHLVDDVPQLV